MAVIRESIRAVDNRPDFPALERELLAWWQARRNRREIPAPQRRIARAVLVPRWSDHGQQPDGRPPRLGPHLQGPLPALPDDARQAPALPERLRLPGALGRGRSREGARSQEQARHRDIRHRRVRRALQGARAANTPTASPSSRSASATGWTGTTPITRCRTRTTTPSGTS